MKKSIFSIMDMTLPSTSVEVAGVSSEATVNGSIVDCGRFNIETFENTVIRNQHALSLSCIYNPRYYGRQTWYSIQICVEDLHISVQPRCFFHTQSIPSAVTARGFFYARPATYDDPCRHASMTLFGSFTAAMIPASTPAPTGLRGAHATPRAMTASPMACMGAVPRMVNTGVTADIASTTSAGLSNSTLPTIAPSCKG